MKLFFSTHNLDKKKEIEYIIKSKFSVLYIDDYKNFPDIDETGLTLEENSLIKARTGFDFTGLMSFADDTALEVDCLNGDPGVFTARYAGENASYEDNYKKLLTMMEEKNCKERTARFRTIVTISFNNNDFKQFEGICNGYIAMKASGDMGFGYDPVFIPEGYRKTFAELESEIKNSISHRAAAVSGFIDFLNNYNGA